MFEQAACAASPPEVIARFDELFERRYPSRTTESTALLDRIGSSWRAQNRGAAAALAAIGELFAYRLTRCSDTEDWAVDTEAAVSAEVAAALRMSQGLAASQLRYARAMRERLPKLAEVFKAGDIDQRTFATIVYRTDLITDRDVLAAVDGQLALTVARWPSMTRGRLAGQIDKIVAKADADAVRRRTERRTEREVWFADLGGGLSEIHGSLLSPDAHALDKRLTALAATVCEHDPRTREQRRADALAALAAGADRLGCRCGLRDCAAGQRPAATPVVIYVIAEQAALDGRSGATASEVCADGLIAPELVAELAAGAKLVPLIHPIDAAPEPGYVPSKKLADFVRCRDLTCRWPGCDRPGIRLRPRPHRPLRRRRAHPCLEPQVLLPYSSPREDVSGAGVISNYPTAQSFSTRLRERPMSPPRAARCSSPASAYPPAMCPHRNPARRSTTAVTGPR